MNASTKDLIILTPDKNTQAALEGLLSRPEALGIRSLGIDIYRHPQHDPGCFLSGVELLSSLTANYQNAILIFDYEGSGAEGRSADEVEADLECKLSLSGWDNRAAVVIIRPELENWVWSDSPHVSIGLGWTNASISLRQWLEANHYLRETEIKPKKPKEAMEAVLYKTRKPRSSSIYKDLAKNVSFKRCSDRSFKKLIMSIQRWYSTTEVPRE